jgi:hypothetical protein
LPELQHRPFFSHQLYWLTIADNMDEVVDLDNPDLLMVRNPKRVSVLDINLSDERIEHLHSACARFDFEKALQALLQGTTARARHKSSKRTPLGTLVFALNHISQANMGPQEDRTRRTQRRQALREESENMSIFSQAYSSFEECMRGPVSFNIIVPVS